MLMGWIMFSCMFFLGETTDGDGRTDDGLIIMSALSASSPASALLSSPFSNVTIVDVNNVRGHTSSRALDQFCEAVWTWWHMSGGDSAVLLCVDHGTRAASKSVAAGFAVAFSGARCDADTDIVHAVDDVLSRHPQAHVHVVTNDRQLQCRCRRVMPELAADADDAWYERRGLEKPGARYAREWSRGAARDASQLERLTLVPSEAFAAQLRASGAEARRVLAAPQSSAATGVLLASYAVVANTLLRLWHLLAWLLGVAVTARAAAASPFSMSAAAVARRAAHERSRRKRRKPAQEAAWRQLEADELVVRSCAGS